MKKKEEILIKRLEVDYDYLSKNKHEISPKETFDCMDEYATYVAKEVWYAALTEKSNLSFNEFWTEFKRKEDEQQKESEYQLNCDYCGKLFWSKEAFPFRKMCTACYNNIVND
jgi:hypothetical protein